MRLVFACLFAILLAFGVSAKAEDVGSYTELLFSAATCGADSDTTLRVLFTQDCIVTSVFVTVGEETGAAVLQCSTQVSMDSVTWVSNLLTSITAIGNTAAVYTPSTTTAASRSYRWMRFRLSEIPATGTYANIKVYVMRQFYRDPKVRWNNG